MSVSPLTRREETRAGIVDAARRCFRRQGVQKTTMADIAEAAGMARQILYRFFSGRDELVEAAIVERIRELAEVLRADLDGYPSFAEALIEASVATIEMARNDTELHSIFEIAGGIRLHHVMAGPYPPVAQIVGEFWRPWFERARRQGEMRSDVSDEDAVEWIRGVYLILILRDDLSEQREREIVARFLLPSLAASAEVGSLGLPPLAALKAGP